MPNTKYLEAIEENNKAQSAYRAVLAEYRAGSLSDDAYLAARAAYIAANEAFDAAYSEAERR